MALYLAFVDCERDPQNGDKPYVAVNNPTLGGYYNKVGGFGSPTTFGIWTTDPAIVAAIEADPNIHIWTDNNQFIQPSQLTGETHPQNVLEDWYNGNEI